MVAPSTRRRLTWSMRMHNLYRSLPSKLGWPLLGIALCVLWAQYPTFTLTGWIALGVSALGAGLVFVGVGLGMRTNRLLSTGTVAGGTLVGITPTGGRSYGLPVVSATFRFEAEDGQQYTTSGTAVINPRLAIQALYALLEYIVTTLAEHQQARTTDPTTNPLVQELTAAKPMDVLRRIAKEGWEAVVKDYAARAVRAVAAEAVTKAATAREAPVDLTDPHTPTQVATLVSDRVDGWLAHTREVLHARITADGTLGQYARGVVDAAHALAQSQTRAWLDPGRELVFYHPRRPGDQAVAAGTLPYPVILAEDGRLRGGNLLAALAVALVPTLVIWGHGIYALARFWPR